MNFNSVYELRRSRPAQCAVLIASLLMPPLAAPARDGAESAQPRSGRTAAAAQPVTLAFRDVEIAEVAAAFSASLGIPILLDGRVKGKVTLESQQQMRLDRAYDLFVSTLALQGFTVVQSDGHLRVVPSAEARQFIPPMSSGSAASGLATRIFTLRHESATQMMQAIRSIVPATNPMIVSPASNSLVIWDSVENLRRIAEIIASLDKSELGEVRVLEVRHAHAGDLAPLLDQLLNRPRGTTTQTVDTNQIVSMLVDSRHNRLVLRGYDRARIDQAERLLRDLDSPLATAGNVHVVYLKNADASRLAQTLQGLYRAGAAFGPGAGRLSPATPTVPMTGQPVGGLPQPGSVPTSAGVASAGVPSAGTTAAVTQGLTLASGAVSDGAIIQAEPTLNALLVVAPEPLYRQIRGVIDKLDVRRAQVYIESLIVEVSSDRAAEFGVQFQFLDGLNSSGTRGFGGVNFGTRGGGTNLLDVASNPLGAAPGLNIGVLRGSISFRGQTIANLGLLARALETSANGNVIATPNLMTLDNEEARIVIGQNLGFITGSFTTSTNQTGNPFQTFERRDVGTTLRVRPVVGEGGSVRMQIFQEVSRVLDLTNASGPVTTKRAIESTVLVEDQQIIVLGGLIEDVEERDQSKVPVLGDIPVVGNLFRYDNRSRKKSNLFVFLRPTVVRSPESGNLLTSGRYEAIQAAREQVPAADHPVLPDLGIPGIPPSMVPPGASGAGRQAQ